LLSNFIFRVERGLVDNSSILTINLMKVLIAGKMAQKTKNIVEIDSLGI